MSTYSVKYHQQQQQQQKKKKKKKQVKNCENLTETHGNVSLLVH